MDKTARDSAGGFSVLAGAAASALGGIVVNAASAAAGAVVGFVGDSIKAAGGFEAGMNQFAAAAGSGMADAGLATEDFQEIFLGLGAKLPVSTLEVQEAAIALVKGGISPATIAAGGLESSLMFATAAGMELVDAAELGVKMLGTFGDANMTAAEQALFLADAQDVMVRAANASTVNVDMLGDALLQAGGQARLMGLSHEELVIGLGAIVGNFSSAAEAGTSYKNFLTLLQPTTKPAMEAMAELGLYTEETGSAFFDASGAYIGNAAAAELLQNATANLSAEQQTLAFKTIFGNDAMGAAANYARLGGEGIDQYAADVAGANGVVASAAATNQGFGYAMENLAGTIEGVQIQIGLMLLPTLTALASIASTLVNAIMGDAAAFAALPGPLQMIVQGAQAIVALFTQMDGTFSSTTAVMTLLIQAFGADGAMAIMQFYNGAKSLANMIIANWQPALAAVAGVITALVAPALAAFVVAVAPVLAVVAAAIAIGVALYEGWNSNFLNIQGITTAVLTNVQALITSVMSVVLAFWEQNGAQIMAFTQQAWSQIQAIIGGVAAIIASLIATIFGGIASFISEHGSEIQTILTFAWNTIQNVIQLALNVIQGIVTTVLGVITGDWETASSGVQQIVEGLGTFLSDQFNNYLALIKGLGPGFLAAAQDIGSKIVDGLINGIKNGIGSVIDAARNMAQEAYQAAMDAIKPGSPSKVFTALGLTIPAGLAQGISLGSPQVGAAAGAMSGAAIGATQQHIRSSSRVVNFTSNNYRTTNNASSDRTIAAALAGV